jgi:hypothetical protein
MLRATKETTMAAPTSTIDYLSTLSIGDEVTVRLTPPAEMVSAAPTTQVYLFGGVTMSGVLTFMAARQSREESERNGRAVGFSAYPDDHGGYVTDFGATLVEVIVPEPGASGETAGAGMRKFTVKYVTTLELTIEVEELDEDRAEDAAAKAAEGYLNTLRGDGRVVAANATIDGLPSDSIVDGFTYSE